MKFRHIAAALVIAGGTVAGALTGIPAASASSFNCQPGAGCATAHSVDNEAKPVAIAIDAKRQSSAPGTLIIGYPDLVQDRATSFDKVLHYYSDGTTPFYTFVYAPNGNWSNECVTADSQTGVLTLETCTLGLDAYQRFQAFIYTAPVQPVVANLDASPPVVGVTGAEYGTDGPAYIGDYSTRSFLLRNDGTGKYLEDVSTSVPTVPQGATDTRQLDANGTLPSKAVGTNGIYPGVPANELWAWNS